MATFAGQVGVTGDVDGQGSNAQFSTPNFVKFDAAGANAYISDLENYAIRVLFPDFSFSTDFLP